MIGQYLSLLLAHASKAPFTTAAKVLTLALGFVTLLTVMGIVSHWRSGDRAFVDLTRTLIVTTGMGDAGDSSLAPNPYAPWALGKYLREDIPELEASARLRGMGDVAAAGGIREAVLSGSQADPAFFDIVQLRFLAGDPKTALKRSDGLVLSADAARRLFGPGPALGRTLVLGGERTVVVTGVLAPLPENSHLAVNGGYDYISAWRDQPGAQENWMGVESTTYLLLPKDGGFTRADVERRLADVAKRRVKTGPFKTTVRFGVTGVERINEMNLSSDVAHQGRWPLAPIFLGLGALVLAVACLNYAALAAAQSAARTREVGLRRVLGARGSGVLAQSLVDSVATTLVALVLAAAFWPWPRRC